HNDFRARDRVAGSGDDAARQRSSPRGRRQKAEGKGQKKEKKEKDEGRGEKPPNDGHLFLSHQPHDGQRRQVPHFCLLPSAFCLRPRYPFFRSNSCMNWTSALTP